MHAAGGGTARRGRDAEASITISLRDAARGAVQRVSLTGEHRGGPGRTFEVKIPPGTLGGTTMRLAGQGEPGPGGGPPGDLLLHVTVAPDERFTVEGRDLVADVPIAPWTAALGGKVSVPTIDAEAMVSVPPGSSSGQRLRLKGKGLPGRGGGAPGDLYAVLRIVVPKTLSDRERDLFEQLRKESTFQPGGAVNPRRPNP